MWTGFVEEADLAVGTSDATKFWPNSFTRTGASPFLTRTERTAGSQ